MVVGNYPEGLGDADDLIEGLEVGVDDDSGVDVSLEETLDCAHDLASEDDHRGGAITDLLVLGASELDHGLGCGVGHIDFSKDGISVVGKYYAAHWVEEHLKHGLGSESGANNVGDGLYAESMIRKSLRGLHVLP